MPTSELRTRVQFPDSRLGELDRMVAQAAVGVDFVFVGSQTPFDPVAGRMVSGMECVGPSLVSMVSLQMVIADVPESRIRAQTIQALDNLRVALESAGSSLDRIVHLRMFLRDQRDMASAANIAARMLGPNLSATTMIEATGPNIDPDIDIQVDAVALTRGSRLPLKHFTVPHLQSLHWPFPTATMAGPLLFTSPISGIDVKTGTLPRRLSVLTQAERALADEHYVNPRDEALVVEHIMMWRNLRDILAAAEIPFENILHQNNWLGVSMQQYVPVTRVRRNLFGLAAARTAATSLPVSNVRTPGAAFECSLIAVRPGQEREGYFKDVKMASHGVGPYYLGAVKAGPCVFAAGEVPIDAGAGAPRLIGHAAALGDGLKHLQFGRIHREIPLMVQAEFVYQLIGKGLADYGCTFADVAHQTVYLVDVGDYPALERMAVLHYGTRLPPTTIVPILGASPFRETLLEIEVTAVSPG